MIHTDTFLSLNSPYPPYPPHPPHPPHPAYLTRVTSEASSDAPTLRYDPGRLPTRSGTGHACHNIRHPEQVDTPRPQRPPMSHDPNRDLTREP
jgi:hypothetical protein